MAEAKVKTTKCRVTRRGVYAPVKKGKKAEELEVGKSYMFTDSQMITHVNKIVPHGEDEPVATVAAAQIKSLEEQLADVKKENATLKGAATKAANAKPPKTAPGK